MDVRFHLPVLSECDAECKLCGPLGCLRPNRLTYPEFLGELDRALLSCADHVVFPPNFLNHPEAAQFCAEVSRKGMAPLVRLRPSQLVPHKHLLSELEFRGARFEVFIVEPLIRFETPMEFKSVFVPSRAHDPSVLFDSLPFVWKKGIEVFADPSLISADQLALFMSEQDLKPYTDTSRAMPGHIPGAFASERKFGQHTENVRLSIITTDVTVKTLESLESQSLEQRVYEVVATGSASDDVIAWCSSHTLAVTLIELPERLGLHKSRLAEAYAACAMAAMGLRFLFLEPGFPVERDFLMRSAEWTQPLVKIESRSTDAPVRCALSILASSYFDQGGFALSHDGFSFAFSMWKTPGVVWVLGDVDKEGIRAIEPRVTAERALSARDFYFATLDAQIYAQQFASMGTRPRLRRVIKFFTSLSLVQACSRGFTGLKGRFRAARLQAMLQKGRA